MKKLLLFFWDQLHIFAKWLHDTFWRIHDFFYRHVTKIPNIASVEETIRAIAENRQSIARFGDGEIKLVAGKNISFQKCTPFIKEKMREVLSSDEKGLLIGLADAFENSKRYNDSTNAYWAKHLTRYRRIWYKYTIHKNKGKKYYNASMTRQYIGLRDKSDSLAIYELCKQIWDDRDVVFIEGEKSRLGIGNDLFDNARSIHRILGPAVQAFSKYHEILDVASQQNKDVLFLLALGPCASVLAYDLHKLGYQAVDIGHIDVEYEWLKMGVERKSAIKNKTVFEAGGVPTEDTLDDPVYHSQIIARIL